MTMMHTIRRLPCLPAHRVRAATIGLATLAWVGLSAMAAPSEGTGGQTVTERALQRPDSAVRRPAAAVAAAPNYSKPAWKDLSPPQQQALQPLAPHWDRLSEDRKLKWLAISKNYARLPAEEQARIHRRMSKWVTLSQQQRVQARQNFKEIKDLKPEQKAAQWEAYQALSPEEKRKLAAQAPARPAGAASVKPASLSKPARGLATRPAIKPGARMAEAMPAIQQHTLLPLPEPVRSETERSPYDDEPGDEQ